MKKLANKKLAVSSDGRSRVFYKLTIWDKITIWWNRHVSERIYRWKCHLYKKYNRVRIRSLPPTWNDRDAVLVHSMFQVLSDFMEQEKPGERVDWDWCETHAHAWKEMQELHRWWHNVYLKFDPYQDLDEEDYEAINKSEEEMEKQLEENCIRLIKIRGHLWT